jgi:hypothetical protein
VNANVEEEAEMIVASRKSHTQRRRFGYDLGIPCLFVGMTGFNVDQLVGSCSPAAGSTLRVAGNRSACVPRASRA